MTEIKNIDLFKRKLGKVIVERREELGLSGYALAKKVRLSQGSCYRIEKGLYKEFTDRHNIVMEFLNIKIKDLVDTDRLIQDTLGDLHKKFNKDTEVTTITIDNLDELFAICGNYNIDIAEYIIGLNSIIETIPTMEEIAKCMPENHEDDLGKLVSFELSNNIANKFIEKVEESNHTLEFIFESLIINYINNPSIIDDYIKQKEYEEHLKQLEELQRKIREYEEEKGIYTN